MTARLNLATTLRKKLGKPLENTTTINLIESLSTKTFRYHTFRTSFTKVAFEHQVMGLLFNSTTEIIICIILQRTSTDNTKSKVAESEIIGVNHLGFTKSLFQHYCQYLGLNHNHISTESAFNFYVNEKISSLLGTPVNTESARKTFYKELIQNTNLPTNHNFASIITEINKEIEHYTQQRYPITYVSKGKEKLQTPAKKNRVEFPSNPPYHYTPGSAINISSTDTFSSTATSAFRQFSFQSRQRKTELLEPYGEYFEGFNLISNPWEAAESEKKEEESEYQEFTYQHPITENPEQNLPPVIVINQLPINPIAKPIQQSLQLPPQQPRPQQLLQQPPQPPNLDPMVYAPIAKLDNFMGEENNAQVWLNDIEKAIAVNRWNDARAILINKPQDFNAFKAEFLRYFSNNNSINHLVNAFTTIKQGETKAVTTYLRCFHRNLCQIQTIDTNYFTALQIFNQFIYGLCSSILQHVHLDFESAESEANHAQAINLVMNGSSELDSKLEKFSKSINKRLEGYLADNHAIYQPPQQHNNQGNSNCVQNQPCSSPSTNRQWQQEMHICHYCGKQRHIQIDCHQRLNNQQSENQYRNSDRRFQTPNQYPNQNPPAYLLVTQSLVYQSPVYQPPIYQPQPQVIYQPQPQIIYQPQQIQTPPQSLPPNRTQRPRMTQQSWRSAIVVHQPIPNSSQQLSGLRQWNSGTSQLQNPNSQNYLSLLITPEDASTSNLAFTQKQPLTSNIPPTTITKDKSLATIFPFEFEKTATMPLFSGAILEAKPITTMYTDAKVEGQFIKLILDSGSAGSIITRQLMDQLGCRVNQAASARIITADGVTKTPIGEIDDFPFEVNGIMTSIKVLVMEATQYQALGQHIRVPAIYGHFKTPPREKLLIELEEEKEKPTWEAYQVSWMDEKHNELLPILFWDDSNKRKGKQKEELTWETDDLTWTDNDEKTTQTITAYNNTYTIPQQSTYCRPKLICIDCDKKLSSMGACCSDNKEYHTTTKFYCRLCLFECFGRPKRQRKWNNQPCLACGETLLDEGIDWVRKETPIEAVWKKAMQQLDSCPHDDDKIWQMTLAKIEGATPEEIKMIKDNLSELLELDWDTEPIINLLDPEQFHEHYQKLALTRKKQEQQLEQLNARLCQHCLIPCDFQYCEECDLIYNPPSHMIYTIPEEEEPISSCVLESELPVNQDSNSDNNDDNNGSSSIQNGNDNDSDSNSDTNSELNYEQYIALPDLSKEQELKWYSDNGKGIMPERVHNTDAGFDLRYPGKNVIKLEPHSHTCIDLKIALEIPATTMV
ncbi:hypothetical protein G9A89_014264 [Geosiphon pyriformis]|nr:hypothetical protein G9A89_014264 [Geosiphon pyriformis]